MYHDTVQVYTADLPPGPSEDFSWYVHACQARAALLPAYIPKAFQCFLLPLCQSIDGDLALRTGLLHGTHTLRFIFLFSPQISLLHLTSASPAIKTTASLTLTFRRKTRNLRGRLPRSSRFIHPLDFLHPARPARRPEAERR